MAKIDTGFYFDELEDYKKELFEKVKKSFPDETKKFLKRSARKLTKVAVEKARTAVDKHEKVYHKSFKAGKLYDRNGTFYCKSFNEAKHAHLIENGHYQVARGENKSKGVGRRSGKGGARRGWTEGKHVFGKSVIEFQPQFFKEIEDFLLEEIRK